MIKKLLLIVFFAVIFPSVALSSVYYLDASAPDALGDGSISTPWKTLAQSKAGTVSGDIVYMATGDYGDYTETDVTRTAYVTYQSLPSAVVHISYIEILNSTPTNTYLKFVGVTVNPDWVDPCGTLGAGCDPYYPTSTQSTFTKTRNNVFITNVNYFQLIDSVLEGTSRHLTMSTVYAVGINDFLMSGCDVKEAVHMIRFIDKCTNVTVIGNHIHRMGGTAINTVGLGYENMLYENNHIHDGRQDLTEPYAPQIDYWHGSGISIRDGGTTVRGNIIHNMGTSSGIMLYADDVGNDYVNENVLIENNLLYDLGATTAVQFDDVGPNVVFRNNTIIGNDRTDSSGYYRYRTGLRIPTIDAQNGPPEVLAYNNIIIGISELANAVVTEASNLVWSYNGAGSFLCDGAPTVDSNTHIYTCTYLYNPMSELGLLFSNDPNMTLTENHGLTLNFIPGENTLAYGRDGSVYQPAKSLGVLDANNGFILDINPLRSSGPPIAGAYGYGAVFSLAGDTPIPSTHNAIRPGTMQFIAAPGGGRFISN